MNHLKLPSGLQSGKNFSDQAQLRMCSCFTSHLSSNGSLFIKLKLIQNSAVHCGILSEKHCMFSVRTIASLLGLTLSQKIRVLDKKRNYKILISSESD